MAFPLKSGADLYNQQLIRAAIWNYSAEILDPKEYVTGLIYFNTNPGSNLYQKLRFRTGTEWKTIAFEEDLDVANNADFQKLKDKVDLLSGDVDTDAIISNMKEVSNFLAGFAEDANLMSVLNGKLDKSGGTITGDLILNSPNSDYALHFQTGLGAGWIGFQADRDRWFVTNRNWSADYALLHSGNIGEYNAGGLVGQYVADLNNATANKIFSSGFQAANIPSENYATGWTLYNDELKYTYQLAYNSSGKLYSRYKTSAWSDWKTIAFTDSNVASAQALVHSNGTVGATVESTGIIKFASHIVPTQDSKGHIGLADLSWFAVYTNGLWAPSGKTLHLGANNSNNMLINPSGNVTIGSSDLAGTSTKLYVNGNAKIEVGNRLHIFADNVFASYDKTIGGFYMYGGIREGEALSCEVAGVGGSWVGAGFKLMQNGNFGIGLTPSAQLHVAQDIVANGTIACKGIAAEGDAMDMVDKTVLHIPSSTTQQTFTLNHGLGTREITVSIYETTTLGTNMILTDVEIVDDNNISVSFGNPPSEEHMVVVMG